MHFIFYILTKLRLNINCRIMQNVCELLWATDENSVLVYTFQALNLTLKDIIK